MTMKLLLGALLVVAGVVFAEDDEDDYFKEAVLFLKECGSRSLSLCFKERAYTYIDQLPNTVEVEGMFMVKQTDGVRAGRQLDIQDLPQEPRAREELLEKMLFDRLDYYLSTHTFEFKIPKESVRAFRQSVEEARKKGKKRGILPLLILFQMKAGLIGALIIKGLALVAFKALLLAKIALTIASIIGLKKLFEQKHHSSTYEVVAHPHFADEHSHFDRSFSQEMAYRGYDNPQSST